MFGVLIYIMFYEIMCFISSRHSYQNDEMESPSNGLLLFPIVMKNDLTEVWVALIHNKSR
jgi:hypothetical protein